MEKYKTGYCPGAFDMFHMGHLNLLKNAKSHCEYLIAGVVTDDVYMSYKLCPPIIPFEERFEIVSQCKYVDRAIGVVAELQDKWRAWEVLRYDCHFAGSDHEGDWIDLRNRLEQVGARMEFFPYTRDTSSTQIRETLERDFVFRRYLGRIDEPVLVLFGAGAIADAFLERYGNIAKPAFFVDNNSKKWGTARHGIRIESPEVLRSLSKEEIYVIVCSKYASDIGRQLVEMGIRDFRVFQKTGC